MIVRVARQFEPGGIVIFNNAKPGDVPQSDDRSRCFDARAFFVPRLRRSGRRLRSAGMVRSCRCLRQGPGCCWAAIGSVGAHRLDAGTRTRPNPPAAAALTVFRIKTKTLKPIYKCESTPPL